ncbi:MAG TPA: SET domain-containing protein-lysine N-methyltransferase [Gemmatimonadaceae bacterium]|nr:SET domain-containing protein-lysine N-methyltransferase [Gemmatimonadaceae bacterium]
MPPRSTRSLASRTARTGSPYFRIRRSAIQGRGAFALRRIRKGTRIIEYTGERISSAEADRRYDDDAMKRHHTFLFTLTSRTVIDAAVNGNDARFINHSCNPNCEAVIEDGHIFIEAIRTIQPGQELTYDYQYEREPGYGEEEERFYMCKCGAPNCRGTILAPKKKKRRRRKASAKSRKRSTRSKRVDSAASRRNTRNGRKRRAA